MFQMPKDLSSQLASLDAGSPLYATQFVDRLLAAAADSGASDVHLHPLPQGLEVRWRVDGVLQRVGEFPRGAAADVVSRLKVLAELLTYRTDVPQEGRIRPSSAAVPGAVEMRVSTFPTLHGERAVVRLFAAEAQYEHLAELGLPGEIETALRQLLAETTGVVLITGPAGSGKTTTAYACLREIARTSEGRRNLVTLEDPIEISLPGVSQSQVHPASGFDLPTGLRSLMRQDPEVILVGEIRDAVTAETVFQAALTGHLVLTTFHAGSAAGALSRLIDMGIEPYLVKSGVRAIIHQRLVRRLCECAGKDLGVRGCEKCRYTGYHGRMVLAELLPPLAGDLGRGLLERRDSVELARLAAAAGMTTVAARAKIAVASGQTDLAEVRRVLGFTEADI